MPSSTSSSERQDARRVALRTLLAGGLILLGGIGFMRCNIELIDVVQAEKKRLREALQALPDVAAQPGGNAFFFGSSLVWNGFDPDAFDGRLHERGVDLRTYNFGFGGLNPEIQLVLARRIRAAYEAEGRRVRLALIEFNAFQTTGRRAEGDDYVRDQHLMMLASPSEIAGLALDSPARAARYFAAHAFRKSISPETVTGTYGFLVSGLGSQFDPEDPNAPRPSAEEQERLDRRDEAARDFAIALLKAEGGVPAMWERDVRGGTTYDRPETHEAIQTMMQPVDWDMREDLERRIRCCDIEELRFDEGLLRDFIALVAELGAVAERVEIVLMPVNQEWVKRTPAARQRLARALERIGRETGRPVIDFESPPGIDTLDFWDATHLSFSGGAKKFSLLLADHYAKSLAPR